MIDYLGDRLQPAAEKATTIATVYPKTRTVVTVPGVHVTQRLAYIERQRQLRQAAGNPLTEAEESSLLLSEAVDLVVRAGMIFIRPDPEQMDQAFAADELLQEEFDKQVIRFLYVRDARVGEAIRHHGQAWRIQSRPISNKEIQDTINSALTAAGGDRIYYYNAVKGTRILTCDRFSRLENLDDEALRQHLREVSDLSGRSNSLRNPELELFMADGKFGTADLGGLDWNAVGGEMRARFADLCRRFAEAVPPAYRIDAPDQEAWRNAMYDALMGGMDNEMSDSETLGLGAEFFRQILWLPGARLEGGELVFDPVPENAIGPEFDINRNMVVRGLICNLMQEYGDIEYVNIGQIISTLSKRQGSEGRREVYVADFRQRGMVRDTLRVIRMQKFGVRENLDKGYDMLRAMIEAEDYTDYIMDRRLACRQLGMNLPLRVSVRKVAEYYTDDHRGMHGARIWSAYFEREYLAGFASDKIPPWKLRDPAYSATLATLLGHAAAPNLIVGRSDTRNVVIFDDSDEVVVEDVHGMPASIIVSDHTGTFGNFRDDLVKMAPSYARPVNNRAKYLPSPQVFAQCYVEAFLRRFKQIQEEYRVRRRAFEGLFKHRPVDPAGNQAYRWLMVLRRLDQSNAKELANCIRENIKSDSA
ncbi:MAG TPA: hypothetical protein VL992_02275 [Tepidisphaeraceae bacterium]|nr:hypothetical protein [Tepidisphaeraceae bacterium]